MTQAAPGKRSVGESDEQPLDQPQLRHREAVLGTEASRSTPQHGHHICELEPCRVAWGSSETLQENTRPHSFFTRKSQSTSYSPGSRGTQSREDMQDDKE